MSEEKEPRITLKKYGINITTADYRALIAIILVIALIALLWKGDLQAAGILAPLTIMAVEWYFRGREKK